MSLSLTTTKFQLSLPFALQSVSPSLAACHAARARLLHPDHASSSPSRCSKCGRYLFDGAANTRTTRTKRARPRSRTEGRSRFIQMNCHSCGHSERLLVPLSTGNASSYRQVRGRVPSASALHISPSDPPIASHSSKQATPKPGDPSAVSSQTASLSTSVSASPQPSSAPSAPQSKKSRPKKKSELREMLARNREKQERDKTGSSSNSAGLAAFLSGL
ncbi:hypothetical protein EW146_g1398 [Bondarzewia mesenterica]|uniref:Uncharacterized protein n=1 Tax=Bondarzewia mesenterica TaxID=1095465 RepID=A0A4S4MA83_9AGAM|nr:hypothetical protein EW146_g1398 [Bondarzewia mesenterica]